jgi:hypothetical protein
MHTHALPPGHLDVGGPVHDAHTHTHTHPHAHARAHAKAQTLNTPHMHNTEHVHTHKFTHTQLPATHFLRRRFQPLKVWLKTVELSLVRVQPTNVLVSVFLSNSFHSLLSLLGFSYLTRKSVYYTHAFCVLYY